LLTNSQSPTSSDGIMLPEGMRNASMKKVRMMRKRRTVPANARTVSQTPPARAVLVGDEARPPRDGAARRPERTSETTLRERVVEEATTAGWRRPDADRAPAGGES
jgi:hypothetical protein